MKPNYKLHSEHDTHYVIHDGQGTFPVIKKGISKRVHQQIQALPHYDLGTDSIPGMDQPDTAVVPFQPGQDPATQAELLAQEPGQRAEGDPTNRPTAVVAGSTIPPPHMLPDGRWSDGSADGGWRPGETARVGGAAVTDKGTGGAGVQDEGEAPPYRQPSATTAEPGYKPQPPPEVHAASLKPLQEATQQVAGAAQLQAHAAEVEGQAKSIAYTDIEKRAQAQKDILQKAQTENQVKVTDMEKAVADGKIDPNHFWSSMDDGHRILAALSLALGSFGASRTHGPNTAWEMIKGQIANDIDAQKANLGKQQNLLSHYMQKGRDLQSAIGQVEQDKLVGIKVAAERISAQYAGTAAGANAAMVAAQAGKELAQKTVDNGNMEAGLRLQNWDRRQQYDRLQAVQGAVGRINSGQGTPQDEATVRAYAPDQAKNIVISPDGKPVFARSDKHQEAYMKDYQDKGDLIEKVRELRVLTKNLGMGEQALGKLGWDSKKIADAQARLQALQFEIPRSLSGLNRVTEVEIGKVGDQIVDPRDATRLRKGITDAQLGAVEDMATKSLYRSYRSNTFSTAPQQQKKNIRTAG